MMQMNLTKLASAFILSSTLVGCAAMVKSPYEAPAVTIPASFQNSTVLSKQVQANAYADQWWTLFGDAQLNQLIQQHCNIICSPYLIVLLDSQDYYQL